MLKPEHVRELHNEGWAKLLKYIAHLTDQGTVPPEKQASLEALERKFKAYTQALADALANPEKKGAFKDAVEELKSSIDENAALFAANETPMGLKAGQSNGRFAYYQYEDAVVALYKNHKELQRRAEGKADSSIEAKPFILRQLQDIATQVMESKDLAASPQDLRDICQEAIAAIKPPELGAALMPGTDTPAATLEILASFMTVANTNIRLAHSAREAEATQNPGRHDRVDNAGISTVRAYNAAKDRIEAHAKELGIDPTKATTIMRQFTRAMEASNRFKQACAHGMNFYSGREAI